MKACYEHLLSNIKNQTNKNGPQTYYKAVKEFAQEEAKGKIIKVLDESLESKLSLKKNILK